MREVLVLLRLLEIVWIDQKYLASRDHVDYRLVGTQRIRGILSTMNLLDIAGTRVNRAHTRSYRADKVVSLSIVIPILHLFHQV